MPLKDADIIDGILRDRDTSVSIRQTYRKRRPFKNQVKSSLRYSLRFLAFYQIQDEISGEWIDDILEGEESPEINTFSDVSVLEGVQPISAHNNNMSEPMSLALDMYKRASADAENRRVRIQLLDSEATYRVYEKRIDGKYPLREPIVFDIVKDKWPT